MFVPPSELGRIWPEIRDRVEEASKWPGEDWLPEHMFHEIMLGGTHLFTTPDFSGFLVTQILVSPYSRKLHVWLASNLGDGARGDFFEQLKSIAAKNDCTSLTWVSDRPGWKRVFPGIRATTLYSFELGE